MYKANQPVQHVSIVHAHYKSIFSLLHFCIFYGLTNTLFHMQVVLPHNSYLHLLIDLQTAYKTINCDRSYSLY